ncbi:MAG: hypothetical protein E7522_08030 [Ruminococcaceae bacterium]|nr:hypothetical protein [Oscillospiraceae bacterium]
MKQLTCEMCGGTDLIKQEGVFVCQNCGMKYSVEEAKKMMIEGTVDVQGTVKVDDTEKVDNYMMMAKNAYESNNNKEAEEYCNKIIEINPIHSEAWLLKGTVAAWQSTGAKLRMDEFFSCIEKTFSNATDPEMLLDLANRAYIEFYNLALSIHSMKVNHILSFPEDYKEILPLRTKLITWDVEIQCLYATVHNAFFVEKPEVGKEKLVNLSINVGLNDLHRKMKEQLISGGIKLWNDSLKEYNSSDDGYPTEYMMNDMMRNGETAMSLLAIVIPSDTSKISDEEKPNIIKACENLIVMKRAYGGLKAYSVSFSNGYERHYVSRFINDATKNKLVEDIKKYHQIIKICNPSYEIPEVEEIDKKPTGNSGGCYVATAVYGSYDCPEVWTLRRYRDYTLAESWKGRAFIRTYYAISPTLVKWFGNTNWFKKMWKGTLDRMVAELQEKGVENTPYQDKNW